MDNLFKMYLHQNVFPPKSTELIEVISSRYPPTHPTNGCYKGGEKRTACCQNNPVGKEQQAPPTLLRRCMAPTCSQSARSSAREAKNVSTERLRGPFVSFDWFCCVPSVSSGRGSYKMNDHENFIICFNFFQENPSAGDINVQKFSYQKIISSR